ncbi:MAG: N-acetylmuramoyl-L-alanine amidase [Vicinamibacteria bacterium]
MAFARLIATGLALGAFLAQGSLATVSAAAAARRPSAQARPDRTLYTEAQAALARLKASPARLARRPEWERVALAFRKVVLSYPRSGYCDNALLAAGDLYRQMARRFESPRDADEAIRNYNLLVAEYPSSSLGEQALHNAFEMARASGDAKRTTAAARAYLEAYPESRRAAAVKQAARPKRQSPPPKRAPAARPAAPAELAADPDALPTPPPPGLTQVFNLRFWSGASSTRVVLDLEKEVPYTVDRLSNPERLFVDLPRTRLHPNLKDRAFPVGDGLLEQVRIGQNRADVVRVVLDVHSLNDQTVFYLADPVRLVIDIRGVETRVADAGRGITTAPAPAPSAAPSVRQAPARPPTPAPPSLTPPAAEARPTPAPTPTTPPAPTPAPTLTPATAPAPDEIASRRRVGELAPSVPAPRATPLPSRPKADVVLEGAPPRTPAKPVPTPTPAVARATPAPTAPEANRSGSYSLARQLGLHARRIVIDAGHGGHDPGTIGPAGLMEKDLVLDVALRLEKRVRSELGADVVLTRSTDLFVPLEERTAIANGIGNSQPADLFLSIHANASRNRAARGIETYFLNFAKNAHAEEVAARENAISEATLKDLQTLVKAITLNSKIDESRDFAATIQEALVANLRQIDPKLPDRGVHTAPFYVLIGANMPSILAEIAFVSHPGEERRLKSPDHRERIAQSLFEGVKRYLESLNRTQTRQLTQAPRRGAPLTPPSARATVTKKGKKR